MSSNEESQPAMGMAATRQEQKTKRTKMLLAVMSALCVAAVVVVCAAVFVASKAEKENAGVDAVEERENPGMQLRGRSLQVGNFVPSHHIRETRSRDSSSSEEEEDVATRHHHQSPQPQRSHANPRFTEHLSCNSTYSDNAVPAAHITSGKRGRWEVPSEPSGQSYLGYEQFWRCSEFSMQGEQPNPGITIHAFVDGGMRFDQATKRLNFPTCGYYYIYSQIQFTSCMHQSRTVFYNLNIHRNCTTRGMHLDTNKITVQGVSSLADGTLATTYTGDIIKVCKGGQMWVEIPDAAVPCHPLGDNSRTFMGAILIAPTADCSWPPLPMLY